MTRERGAARGATRCRRSYHRTTGTARDSARHTMTVLHGPPPEGVCTNECVCVCVSNAQRQKRVTIYFSRKVSLVSLHPFPHAVHFDVDFEEKVGKILVKRFCLCTTAVCACLCVCNYWIHGESMQRHRKASARRPDRHTAYTHKHTYIHGRLYRN